MLFGNILSQLVNDRIPMDVLLEAIAPGLFQVLSESVLGSGEPLPTLPLTGEPEVVDYLNNGLHRLLGHSTHGSMTRRLEFSSTCSNSIRMTLSSWPLRGRQVYLASFSSLEVTDHCLCLCPDSL